MSKNIVKLKDISIEEITRICKLQNIICKTCPFAINKPVRIRGGIVYGMCDYRFRKKYPNTDILLNS